MSPGAWRWISGRPTVVSPADGLEAVACELRRIDPCVLVLEPAQFSAYDERYTAGSPRADVGGVKVFDYRSECEIVRR